MRAGGSRPKPRYGHGLALLGGSVVNATAAAAADPRALVFAGETASGVMLALVVRRLLNCRHHDMVPHPQAMVPMPLAVLPSLVHLFGTVSDANNISAVCSGQRRCLQQAVHVCCSCSR